MQPDNLPLIIGHVEGDKATAVEKAFKNPDDLKENLLTLGRYFKLKVWFKEPVKIRTIRRKVRLSDTSWRYEYHKESDVHVFPGTFKHGADLCYLFKKSGRHGDLFPDLNLITRYEIVRDKTKKEFDSYEDFKKRFDPYFITEDRLKDLWNSKSAQHGGKYCPADFHKIGPKGKECLRRFLNFYKGVENGGGTGYIESPHGDYSVLSERMSTYHHSGRDITIEHSTNNTMVFYSSEYAGCGNGRYGIVATRNTFLWLEDD